MAGTTHLDQGSFYHLPAEARASAFPAWSILDIRRACIDLEAQPGKDSIAVRDLGRFDRDWYLLSFIVFGTIIIADVLPFTLIAELREGASGATTTWQHRKPLMAQG